MFIAEEVIRDRPRSLLIVCEKGDRRVLRCRCCYLGFAGSESSKESRLQTYKLARRHIRGAHDEETRKRARSKA